MRILRRGSGVVEQGSGLVLHVQLTEKYVLHSGTRGFVFVRYGRGQVVVLLCGERVS
jgi:hypothetical protein